MTDKFDWEHKLRERLPYPDGRVHKDLRRKIEERVAMKRSFPLRRPMKWAGMAVMACLLVLILTQKEQWADWIRQEPKPAVAEELTDQRPLKVLTWSTSDGFYGTYGRIYMARNPEVDLQAVGAYGRFQWASPAESIKKLMQEEQPDVVVLPPGTYFPGLLAELADELTPLDSWMSRDGWSADRLHPAVRQQMQAGENGQIYGLAPTMSNLAVYYNRELFERHGVPAPKDGMTWEELFGLAERFPAETGITGLQWSRSGGELAAVMAASMKLGSPSGSEASAADWTKLLRLLQEASAAGRLKERPEMGGSYTMEQFYKKLGFSTGTAAMYIAGFETAQDLKKYAGSSLRWEVVSLPSHDGESAEVNAGETFAIPSNAGDKDAAWKLIRDIHSKELSRLLRSGAHPDASPLLSQPALMPEMDFHVEAFYAGKPAGSRKLLPPEAASDAEAGFSAALSESVNGLMKGRLTPEAALQQLQRAALAPSKGEVKP